MWTAATYATGSTDDRAFDSLRSCRADAPCVTVRGTLLPDIGAKVVSDLPATLGPGLGLWRKLVIEGHSDLFFGDCRVHF